MSISTTETLPPLDVPFKRPRGRRGCVVPDFIAEDQRLFRELKAVGGSRVSKRSIAHDKLRAKLLYADEKAFRLRGFHGKDQRMCPKALVQPGDIAHSKERNQGFANLHRVRSGTGGLPKKTRRFFLQEGMLGTQRLRPIPRTRVRVSVPKHVVDVSYVVSRFRRFAQLPDCTLDELQAGNHSGVDQRWLRRLEQAMRPK